MHVVVLMTRWMLGYDQKQRPISEPFFGLESLGISEPAPAAFCPKLLPQASRCPSSSLITPPSCSSPSQTMPHPLQLQALSSPSLHAAPPTVAFGSRCASASVSPTLLRARSQQRKRLCNAMHCLPLQTSLDDTGQAGGNARRWHKLACS